MLRFFLNHDNIFGKWFCMGFILGATANPTQGFVLPSILLTSLLRFSQFSGLILGYGAGYLAFSQANTDNLAAELPRQHTP